VTVGTSRQQQHWLNQWHKFGAGLSVWLTNDNDGWNVWKGFSKTAIFLLLGFCVPVVGF